VGTGNSNAERVLLQRLLRASLLAGVSPGDAGLAAGFAALVQLLRPVKALTQAAAAWPPVT
jgi:hypothetical protein